jgi:hypothetical protein
MSHQWQATWVIASAGLVLAALPARAELNGITYQGLLQAEGVPADGQYDFEFTLYDAAAGGTRIAGPIEVNDHPVNDGRFTVVLGFTADEFDGTRRWLEIAVRLAPNSQTYNVLMPRQELTATPYAFYAARSDWPWKQVRPNAFYCLGSIGIGAIPPTGQALYVEGAPHGIEAVGTGGGGADRPYGVFAGVSTDAHVNTGGGLYAGVSSSNAPNVGVLFGARVHINDDANRRVRGFSVSTVNEENDDYGVEVITNDPGYALHVSGTGRSYFAGAVGIGTEDPGEALHVAGNICATGSIGSCSDGRLKHELKPIDDALARVGRLEGVFFRWRPEVQAERGFAGERQVGLVAQSVDDVVPECVARGSDGRYAVDYGRLTPVLVEAVKALSAQVERQQAQLAKQEQAIRALREALARQ